jgi:predicted Zn-dependent protease
MVRWNAGRLMEDYDRVCLRSWIECGFHILSINEGDEIPALAARYPEVEFVPASRNASSVFGRKLPFIADMLCVLARQTAPVLGIINSDVIFEPVPAAWEQLEMLVARKTIASAQRLDARSLAGGALHRYTPGFDGFFFDRAAAENLAQDSRPFTMGLPWWDYWLPVMLALRGYAIECIARPAMLHLFHQSRTDARSRPWRALALEYARSVTAECEAADRPPPPQWQELVALCRQLAEAPDGAPESGELDEHIIHLSELSVPIIANNFVALDAAKATVSAPSVFFFNLADRVDAGDALYKALWQEDHGRHEEAQRLYWQAVEKAPNDPGTLSSCGNYLLRQGDLAQAVMLLRKAVERAPDSAMLLNSFGSALGRLGRQQEAILCFERALRVDPLYGASYYNLVIALYPRDAYREIIGRLEERVRQTPDFSDGQHWLGEIRQTVARLEGGAGVEALQNR